MFSAYAKHGYLQDVYKFQKDQKKTPRRKSVTKTKAPIVRMDRLWGEIILPSLRPVVGYIVGEMVTSEIAHQRQFIDLTTL